MGLKEFLQSVDDTLNKFGESVSGVVDKMNTGTENFNQSMSGAMDRMGDSLQNTWDSMSAPKDNGQNANIQPNYSTDSSIPSTPSTPSVPDNSQGAFAPQPIKQAQFMDNSSVSTSIVNSVEGPLNAEIAGVENASVMPEKKVGVNIKKEV